MKKQLLVFALVLSATQSFSKYTPTESMLEATLAAYEQDLNNIVVKFGQLQDQWQRLSADARTLIRQFSDIEDGLYSTIEGLIEKGRSSGSDMQKFDMLKSRVSRLKLDLNRDLAMLLMSSPRR